MLQLHLSDRQLYCLLRCVLYWDLTVYLIICCSRDNDMSKKRTRKTKTRVRHTKRGAENTDFEDISDYSSSGGECGLDEEEDSLDNTSSGDEWHPVEVNSGRKTKGKSRKAASVRAEFEHQFPKWVPNPIELLPSLGTCDKTLTSPPIRGLLSSSVKALPSTQPRDVPSLAIFDVNSPSAESPNVTSPHAQSPHVISPHPQSLNVTSLSPPPLSVTSPPKQSLDVTSPSHQSADVTLQINTAV